jgi:hypothetical protein
MDKVSTEPLVVMSKIMYLVRHDSIAHHIGMINTGRSLLLIDGIVVELFLGIYVTRHMPEVGNTWTGLPTDISRIESLGSLLMIPEMYAKVMGGMHGVDTKHLL